MHYSTHTIPGVGVCVTTYERETDGTLYISDVNGLDAEAVADWLREKLLKLEEAQATPREDRGDREYRHWQEERWHGQWERRA